MKKIQKILMNNIKLKIIALLSAFLIWGYVMSVIDPVVTRTIDGVNVELQNIDELNYRNLSLMSSKDVTVSVKVSGRKSTIYDVKATDIRAQADAKGYGEGEVKAPIFVSVPESIEEIRDYYPKEVLFDFEKIVEKQIPVTLELEGEVAENYMLGEPSIKPNAIIVRGPRSLVNSVDKIVAKAKLVSGEEALEVVVPVTLFNSKNEEITSLNKEPGIVSVEQPLYKSKYVSIRPKFINFVSEEFELIDYSVSPDLVKIFGPPEIVSNLTIIESNSIDLSKIDKSISFNLKFDLPEGVLFESEINPKISFDVEPLLEKEIVLVTDDIKLQNVKTDYIVSFEEEEIEIKLKAKDIESKLTILDTEEFGIYVDIKDLEEGKHDVPIQIYNPRNINVELIDTESISVVIKKAEEQEWEEN